MAQNTPKQSTKEILTCGDLFLIPPSPRWHVKICQKCSRVCRSEYNHSSDMLHILLGGITHGRSIRKSWVIRHLMMVVRHRNWSSLDSFYHQKVMVLNKIVIWLHFAQIPTFWVQNVYNEPRFPYNILVNKRRIVTSVFLLGFFFY